MFSLNATYHAFGENINTQYNYWDSAYSHWDYADLLAPSKDDIGYSYDTSSFFNDWMSDFMDGVSFYLTLKFMSDLFEVDLNKEEMTMFYMLSK